MLKGVVYKRPTILYISETWCLEESRRGILQRTKGDSWRDQCVENATKVKKELRT